MAPSRTPYDPIVSVEGMYKGSLTRLGYFFKDPKLYGEATLAVLRETAKRYDDALDDCLIQILDAKWLLEHELAQNRARRAKEAAEIEAASSKRKMEDDVEALPVTIQDDPVEEKSAKRSKTQHITTNAAMSPGSAQGKPMDQVPDPGRESDAVIPNEADRDTILKNGDVQKEGISGEGNGPHITSANGGANHIDETTLESQPAAEHDQESKEHEVLKDPPDQPAPQEDVNFESMFADIDEGSGQSNNGLDLHLDLNPDNLTSLDALGPSNHETSNLELLPGLTSYANASGEDSNLLNLPTSSTNTLTTATQGIIKAPKDGLELSAEIPVGTDFNDLFADGDIGGNTSLMDLDLEDGFFNT